jgi:hypothetical protein
MLNNVKEFQNGVRSFQYYSRKILTPIFKNPKFNFLYTIAKNWKGIVGKKYEDYCKVEKVTLTNENRQGNVYVISYNSSVSFYLNNNKEYIIEKLNVVFGYRAVLNLFVKEIPTYVNVKKEVVKIRGDEKKIEMIVSKIENNDLKKSLLELGVSIGNIL